MKNLLKTLIKLIGCLLLIAAFAMCAPHIVRMETPEWAKPHWTASKDGTYYYTTNDKGEVIVLSATRANSFDEAKRLCGVCTIDNYYYFVLTPLTRKEEQ